MLIDECGGMGVFAEKTGIPYQTVRQYLRKSEPTRPVMLRIAQGLKVDLNWLIEGREDSTSYREDFVPSIESEYLRRELNRRLTDDKAIQKLAQMSDLSPRRIIQLRQDGEPSLTETIRLSRALDIKTFPAAMPGEFDGFVKIPEIDPMRLNLRVLEDFNLNASDGLVYRSGLDIFKEGKVAVHESEIDTRYRTGFGNLGCFRVTDGAWNPELTQGELVIIDIGDDTLENEQFFLTRLEGRICMRKAIREGLAANHIEEEKHWRLLRVKDEKQIPFSYQELYGNSCIVGKKIGVALK